MKNDTTGVLMRSGECVGDSIKMLKKDTSLHRFYVCSKSPQTETVFAERNNIKLRTDLQQVASEFGNFCPRTYDLSKLSDNSPPFFSTLKIITESLGKNEQIWGNSW